MERSRQRLLVLILVASVIAVVILWQEGVVPEREAVTVASGGSVESSTIHTRLEGGSKQDKPAGLKAEPEPEQSFMAVTSTDERGQESRLQPRKLTALLDLLEQKHQLDPDDELRSLAPIDFREVESGMFMGDFKDEKAGVKFALYSALGGGALEGSSCIELPGKQKVTAARNLFKLRDRNDGYAVLAINDRHYIRMGYTFLGPRRALVGKLYQKNQGEWAWVTNFQAAEFRPQEPNDTCDVR